MNEKKNVRKKRKKGTLNFVNVSENAGNDMGSGMKGGVMNLVGRPFY